MDLGPEDVLPRWEYFIQARKMVTSAIAYALLSESCGVALNLETPRTAISVLTPTLIPTLIRTLNSFLVHTKSRDMPFTLPPIPSLPSQPAESLTKILDTLFEPSTPLHTLSINLLRSQNFPTYNDLIASVGVQLTDLLDSTSTSDTEWLDSILRAHPRLGATRVESEQSQKEQAGFNEGAEEEARKLGDLNQEYEAKFPGLRYVVFVNGRSRAVIMENMRARIDRGDVRAERGEAIKAMCDIAADRASMLS